MAIENASDASIVAALTKLAGDQDDVGTFVVLGGDSDRNYYIQFAKVDGLLWCEAVSNHFLTDPHTLDEDQEAALERLGWRQQADVQNWTCTFEPNPGSFAEILAFARRTFTDVYRLPDQTPLRLETDSDDDSSDQLPILRLITEAGEVWDDPSEDAMFEYMSDLAPGNAWLEVQRLEASRPNDAFRVTIAAAPEFGLDDTYTGSFNAEVRLGSTIRRSQAVAYRVVHEALTLWAFDLPEWDRGIAWD